MTYPTSQYKPFLVPKSKESDTIPGDPQEELWIQFYRYIRRKALFFSVLILGILLWIFIKYVFNPWVGLGISLVFMGIHYLILLYFCDQVASFTPEI